MRLADAARWRHSATSTSLSLADALHDDEDLRIYDITASVHEVLQSHHTTERKASTIPKR